MLLDFEYLIALSLLLDFVTRDYGESVRSKDVDDQDANWSGKERWTSGAWRYSCECCVVVVVAVVVVVVVVSG